jgi:hypothetical protein
MRYRSHRKLTLLDVMILIAGMALGMGLTRLLSSTDLVRSFDPHGPLKLRWGESWTAEDWAHWAYETVGSRFEYLMPLFAALTASLLVLRMRSPRPRRARLFRQPGFVASVASLFGIAVWVPQLTIHAVGTSHESVGLSLLVLAAATAVGSSWMALIFGGRWRAEPEWIDRLGRLFGAIWIAPIPYLLLGRFFD